MMFAGTANFEAEFFQSVTLVSSYHVLVFEVATLSALIINERR